ncbi:hypothetical protein BAE44_0008626 [Dichanthelium oligosanthes]|uniref:Fatty acyl-CoA reductase C-terminal domain-containing protein n=1 Tax=Dichanthelium oligosanthes TaxID=888268 RepID=A0A1E5VZ51_9POAL|nr:hypothetical protein BAE44_0008626 [Dichanthelium oligosanthes]
MGETPKPGCCLDIEAELELIREVKATLTANSVTEDSSRQLEKMAMKELGLKRTIDTVIVAYDEQTIPCFVGDHSVTIDVIPGDMVVSAAMVAMAVHYGEETQMLYLVNLLLGGLFSELHNKLNRNYNFLMLLAKLYAPFAFFKGCFDDTNLRKLWRMTCAGQGDGCIFNFDPNRIDWSLYLFKTHIPAALKISRRKKDGRAA